MGKFLAGVTDYFAYGWTVTVLVQKLW